MGYNSVIKRNKILTLTTVWVNLENIRPSEISPTQKKKKCVIPLIRGTGNRRFHGNRK